MNLRALAFGILHDRSTRAVVQAAFREVRYEQPGSIPPISRVRWLAS